MASSLVHRVAAGAALAASAAALLAALATTLFASVWLQRAEDRRLTEAAVVFAAELSEDGHDLDAIHAVHREESGELEHTGMLFAVYDANARQIVGDPRVGLPPAASCSTHADVLRVCRAASTNGLTAVVGAAHTTTLPRLAGAAVMAALAAAALAWGVSRPLSRQVTAPLTRLRARIAQLDLRALAAADLGADEQVVEVDALRTTLNQLIERIELALAQAHRFAANAAHELRTPLTSVRAELELLAEDSIDPRAREGVVCAQRKLDELALLVERLLILSVPARSPTDAQEVVSLRDLFEDVVAALPERERARVRLTDGDALVRGDAVLLGTMIANAIANGLKFGDTVNPSVSLTADAVLVHVDDDGPGLDHARRELVFEPFFRTEEALRRRVPGHGLGLALIRHIAAAHGGDATFAEPQGRGARLTIRLPRAEPIDRTLAPSGTR